VSGLQCQQLELDCGSQGPMCPWYQRLVLVWGALLVKCGEVSKGDITAGLAIGIKGDATNSACMHEMVSTSNWIGAVALGTHMPQWQQQGRLLSRGSCWEGRVPEPSCWRDPHSTRVYIHLSTYIFSSSDFHPAQPERGAR